MALSMREAFGLVVGPTLAFMARAGRDPAARARYASPSAAAMVLTAGQVESGFRSRHQLPVAVAHSWWMIEPPTVRDFLARDGETAALLDRLGLLGALEQDPALVEFSEVAACVLARRLLYERGGALPELVTTADEQAAECYRASWRPGAYRHDDACAAWRDAVAVVSAAPATA